MSRLFHPALIAGLLMVLLVLGLSLWANAAFALTLQWDRNAEADMKDYGVYGCFVKGCTVVQSPATLQTFVVQTATGVLPTWPVPVGKEGALSVSARDSSLNESGLSVSVPFDVVAPNVPTNPVLK